MPLGKGPHVREAGQAHRRAGRFGAAGDHDVGIVVLNRLERVAHRVGGAGTGGGHGVVRAAQAVADRNVPAGRVEHQLGNRERGDVVRALGDQPLVLRFDFGEAADAGAENHAAAERVFLREVEARVVHRVDAGHQRELREAVDPLFFLAIDVAVGRPVVDVAAELDLVAGGVERLQLVNAALAAQNLLPQVVDLAAQRRDGTNAGDDDASFHEEAESG